MTVALVDCESFYASCETVFRPDLKYRPIVVLSNNDGCVIARSMEAKDLGITMGIPWFKIRENYLKKGGVVFSSNYTLYGDLSSRVMNILRGLSPEIECYSIDEAFLGLSSMPSDFNLYDFGCHIRRTIKQWVGIPVRVGIAPTKTLTKVAIYQIKKQGISSNVLHLIGDAIMPALEGTPVGEVWGIGARLNHHLNRMGIKSAYDLAMSDPQVMRNKFSVVLERTIRELNGQSRFEINQYPAVKKQIMVSRSLHPGADSMPAARRPLSHFVARACEKLRLQRQRCRRVTIFIGTNPFAKSTHENFSISYMLTLPSNDTRKFMRIADSLLKKIFRLGHRYTKVGVMLDELCPENFSQGDFFEKIDNSDSNLMHYLDEMNHRGAKIFFGTQGESFRYTRRQLQVSPRYTTNWNELPVVS
jgi:DNA polymerase V